MITKFIEASHGGGGNWGKFCVARWIAEEWARRSELPEDGMPLLPGRGWTADHVWVFDLQTGEAACFRPGGYAAADLTKHRIWVCPLFEPFLHWLYTQDLSELDALPGYIELPEADFALAGYRRPGLCPLPCS